MNLEFPVQVAGPGGKRRIQELELALAHLFLALLFRYFSFASIGSLGKGLQPSPRKLSFLFS